MTPSSSESSIFRNPKLRSTGLVPALLAVCLFAFSLLGAWNASRQTEYPPIHDVLSYTTKAENVWAELRQGNFTGLLGVEQTIRPFGTSLLGYPLGYSDDFRAFYWRTVAFPACFAALGAFFAALAAGASWHSPSAWLLACLCGMMPMWWAFDPIGRGGISYWGMMDGMQAGVAAMATGLLLLGWRRNSAAITFAGFFLSAFTLLIKPVGIFLIAGEALAAVCLWTWSFKNVEAKVWRRFAAGVLWGLIFCTILGAICFFSPYFSEANREMGRQALDQLKANKLGVSFAEILIKLIQALAIYGFGATSLFLFGAFLFRHTRMVLSKKWMQPVCCAAILVLLLQLAALYQGTHFLTPRYFLPALATVWIFVSPFLWNLIEESRFARILVLLNAVILFFSVFSDSFAREWHKKTGYATFINSQATTTYELAKSALAKSELFSDEPIIYILPGSNHYTQGLLARQLENAGDWKPKLLWSYGPRVWEKHSPVIHSHEIAAADFLITGYGEFFSAAKEALREIRTLLEGHDAKSLAPIIAGDQVLAIRRITDPIALERVMLERLMTQGNLIPGESGPILAEHPTQPAIAAFQSGDDLVDAKAEWVEGKLRITSTWSGTRVQKGHLAMNVAFCNADGTEFHWITCSLLPPPKSSTGPRYQRTIVDELDCGSFGDRIHSVSLGIYDRYNKAMIPLATPGGEGKAESVSIPLTRILELSTP